MNALTQIGILIFSTLGGLYLLIVLLRFLLQIARADFYNPLSQAIAKATNPLLLPMRRLIPSVLGLDVACIVLALAVQFVTVFSGLLLIGTFNPLMALLWGLLGIVSMAMYIYFVCMVAMIILSWVAPQTRHPAAMLAVQLVRPLCAPIQRVIPAMGGLDISPVFVFLLLQVARMLVENTANYLGIIGGLRNLVPGLL
ncbi:MAG TPA: YggT family protein [Pseudomonadales bacterium]|nr:YggT family protein [Pseudomonadales bacterium]